MKKVILFFALMLMGMTVLMTACKKEKDETQQTTTDNGGGAAEDDVAVDIATTYRGVMNVSLQEMPAYGIPPIEDMEIRIAAVRSDAVDIVLPVVTYTMSGRDMVLPSITVTFVNVSKTAENSYVIKQKSYETMVDGKSVVAMVQGTVQDSVLTLDYSMKYGSMPMTLLFNFVSAK